jgi:hypothetical protein
MNATLGQIKLRKVFSLGIFFSKMQPNALLDWQSFIIQKVGVTDIPPLKGISPLRFGRAGKKLWVVRSEFFYMLLGCFIFDVVTPLNLAHPNNLTASHSLRGLS